jgi:hypothetical protein
MLFRTQQLSPRCELRRRNTKLEVARGMKWHGAGNGVGDCAITEIGPCCLGTNSLSVGPVTQFNSAVK